MYTCLISNVTHQIYGFAFDQVLRAKDGMPSQFQSYWEMDEKGVDEDTEEEIQSKYIIVKYKSTKYCSALVLE